MKCHAKRFLIAIALLWASNAASHHAEASFDHSKRLSATGAVKEFLWANPHVLIYLDIIDSKGRKDVVVFECGSVYIMGRRGWSSNSPKVGDTVTVEYFPRRDGKPGGMLVRASIAGKAWSWYPAVSN